MFSQPRQTKRKHAKTPHLRGLAHTLLRLKCTNTDRIDTLGTTRDGLPGPLRLELVDACARHGALPPFSSITIPGREGRSALTVDAAIAVLSLVHRAIRVPIAPCSTPQHNAKQTCDAMFEIVLSIHGQCGKQ